MSAELYPMSLSPARQYEIFVLAVFAGLSLGAVYDVLRALRRGLLKSRAAENILDFFFSLFAGFVYFVFCTAQAGSARLFVVPAMLLGAAAERFTSGRLICFLLTPVFALLRKALAAVFQSLMTKLNKNSKSFL